MKRKQKAAIFACGAITGAVCILPRVNHGAEYSFTDLNPTGFTESYGYGICGNQQVGSGHGPGSAGNIHALLWNGSNLDLNPSGFTSSGAAALHGKRQVGSGYGPATGENYDYHALLWTGTAESVVDLNPSGFIYSYATGLFDNQQVGAGYGPATGQKYHALLWTGTPTSVVDLNPVGFTETHCNGTSGTHQIGLGFGAATGGNQVAHALLWAGTANSVVDLNPAGFSETYGSGISGNYQVGFGERSATGQVGHGLLWAGTAESAIELTPNGFIGSVATAISGSNLVGYAWGPADGYRSHAVLWSGLGANVVDLQTFLSSEYDQSEADAIDAKGNIVGKANYVPTGYSHAIRWSPLPDSVVICNNPNLCGAVWTFSTGPAIICNPPSGSFFPVGSNIVICTATAPSGIRTNPYVFTIIVKDCEPPTVFCQALDNSGKHSLHAQPTKHLYRLLGADNCDPNPQLFIMDSATGLLAGPMTNGTIVKITRNRGGGHESGGINDSKDHGMSIAAQVHLRGDGLLYGVDASGNIGASVVCPER